MQYSLAGKGRGRGCVLIKKRGQLAKLQSNIVGYDSILAEVVNLLESARRGAARAVNSFITATYWEIGRRIVQWEQGGESRADYGEYLMDRLSVDLSARYGRGFSRRAVYQMRAFYLAYPAIVQTPSAQLSVKAELSSAPGTPIVQSPIAQFQSPRFPLAWTHYVRLLAVKNESARKFYETQALRGGWSIRQLDRQIDSLYYERAALSKNKAAMLTKGHKPTAGDTVTPEEEIKDPFVLEFLHLKDEYSETQLEEALILHLESFLLELGDDFAFLGRQRRIRIGDQWFRVDLLFFHRRLKCLVVIDLKTGKFTHADAGQMHLYLNYAAEYWTKPGENPPVGLILCAQKDAAVVHYALENLPNKVIAAEYKMKLPDEATLANEMDRTRRALEVRSVVARGGGRK
ncbi:MAG: DUF1016 domain-containing protein [Phycisphaerales bacterium]|nr:DUF1016 domain-containing protein [Phycisphaerales bacterium]